MDDDVADEGSCRAELPCRFDCCGGLFLGRESMAAVPDSFAIVVADLRAFLLPLLGTPSAGGSWARGGPWSTGVLDDE